MGFETTNYKELLRAVDLMSASFDTEDNNGLIDLQDARQRLEALAPYQDMHLEVFRDVLRIMKDAIPFQVVDELAEPFCSSVSIEGTNFSLYDELGEVGLYFNDVEEDMDPDADPPPNWYHWAELVDEICRHNLFGKIVAMIETHEAKKRTDLEYCRACAEKAAARLKDIIK